jgi:hypothetical protein
MRKDGNRRGNRGYIYSKLILFWIRHAVFVTFEVDQDTSPARLAELMSLLLIAEVVLSHVVIAYLYEYVIDIQHVR